MALAILLHSATYGISSVRSARFPDSGTGLVGGFDASPGDHSEFWDLTEITGKVANGMAVAKDLADLMNSSFITSWSVFTVGIHGSP